MVESVETAKDVEKQLTKAKGKLQAFEDGVDYKRLLKRLRRSSPAHPVLIFRGLFMLGMVGTFGGAIGVMVASLVNADMARRIARFDAVVPVPEGVPGLPALLAVLGVCMLVGWGMTTLAALAMGRDAQMLPWEQTQHQKLMNEVTRLTTQKAVMERMRSTPAGARPRINTPVPVNMRDRAGIATPSGMGRLSGSGAGAGAGGRFGPPPDSAPAGAAMSQNPFGRAPSSSENSSLQAGGLQGGAPAGGTPAGSAGFGGAPAARDSGGANPFAMNPNATPPGAPVGGQGPTGGGGVLARARSGSVKTTPAGAAGRLNLMGEAAGAPNNEPITANPFASPPKPSIGNPFSGGNDEGPSFTAPAGANPFGAPTTDQDDDIPAIVDNSAGSYSSSPFAQQPSGGLPMGGLSAGGASQIPNWGAIEDPWLEEALQKAEALAGELPEQAHIDFSQEVHLPFTLVISRTSPAVAVRSMVSFVEFLSTIPTPQRARIELSTNSSLDRSFHRNVEAALEPYYGEAFVVDLEPGRVEIAFHDYDSQWLDHEVLPIQ